MLWSSLQGALPTKLFLWRQRIVSSPLCEVCRDVAQSDLHILRDCGLSSNMWRALLPPVVWSQFFSPSSVAEWFEVNLLFRNVISCWPKHWAYIFSPRCSPLLAQSYQMYPSTTFFAGLSSTSGKMPPEFFGPSFSLGSLILIHRFV